jgi:replicative DNA helicase
MDKDIFETKLDKIRSKSHGKLVIKEYPTGSAHAGHFRALIEELKQKRNFTADLIIIDYLGICASQRVKNTAANSYTILGSVAEELRALGQEYDVPVLTAVQINRGGIESSDMDMTDTSDSMKIVHALDLYLGLIRTDELDELGQVLCKVLKNRYGNPNSKFVIGVDFGKSQWYEVEGSAQQGIQNVPDDKPVFDKSKFGKRMSTEGFKF